VKPQRGDTFSIFATVVLCPCNGDHPVKSPKDILLHAKTEKFFRDSGDPVTIRLFSAGGGLNEELFRKKYKKPLTKEVAELLELTPGFGLGYSEVHFTETQMQGYHFLFPDWMELCGDGFGNFWVAEVQDQTHDWKPIWFVCHDPPVVVRVADDLAEFIDQVLDVFRKLPTHKDNWFNLSHDCANQVWESGGIAPVSASEARKSADPDIAALANQLPSNGSVIDLRACPKGSGFSWESFDAYKDAIRKGPLLWGFTNESSS